MTAKQRDDGSRAPHPWMWAASVAVLLAAGATLVLLFGDSGGDDAGATLVASSSGAPAPPQVDAADFLGSESCAQCHADEYAAWSGSTHGRAGGDPSPETIIAPFDGTPIRFADARVVPTRTEGGDYIFQVAWRDEPVDTLVVEGVVGRGHMIGGGTQGFFTGWPDGTSRFVPFDWSRTEGRWFCNSRWPDPGEWLPITEELRLAQCADWSPSRVLGSLDRWANCQQCHGSQIRAGFDPEAREYRTGYTTLEVNCESCHGPGRRHVELARSGSISASADIGIQALGVLDKDASLGVCFRCHATKRTLRPDDFPGEDLDDNYSLLLPLLTDRTLHPDGRVRIFGYQLNHLASDCYLNGSMTCVSCHEPHSQAYRDEDLRPLRDRFDDGQCTGCHASKIDRVEEHSRHPRDSEGSKCVSCHMPYLQHPSVGDDIRYARSDHVIPIPRPGGDEAMGVRSACAQCHQDMSTEDLQAAAADWWGEIKPRKPLVAGVLASDSTNDARAAARFLLRPQDDFPMAQYMALSRYALRFMEPDMEALPAAVSQALLELGESDDLDLKSLALAAHHLARGESPAVRSLLQEGLSVPPAERQPLVDRWSLALDYFGETYRFRGAPQRAAASFAKALEVKPGDAELLQKLGESLVAAGRAQDGVVRLRESVEADPTRTFGWQSLGAALESAGQPDDALEAYREAVERNPWEPAAHFRLGNALLARGDFAGAESSFRRTLELDASIASARVGLAQILARSGDPTGALRQLELALEFEPGNAQARQLLSRLR